MDEIAALVDDTPFITGLQKRFYKTMLTERKERILDFSLTRLLKRERKRPLLLVIFKAYRRAGIQLFNLSSQLADEAGIALNQLGAGFRVSVLNHQAKCFVR